MALTWPGEHQDRFLIRVDRAQEQGVSGYAFASVSDIADKMGDNAYASEIGEEGDTFSVWRLANDFIAPVTVTCKRHDPIGQVEVILTWRVAVGGGKYEKRTESGYYRIVGA